MANNYWFLLLTLCIFQFLSISGAETQILINPVVSNASEEPKLHTDKLQVSENVRDSPLTRFNKYYQYLLWKSNDKKSLNSSSASSEESNSVGLPTNVTKVQMLAIKSLLTHLGYYNPNSKNKNMDHYLSRLRIILKISTYFFPPLAPIKYAIFAIKVYNIVSKAVRMYNSGTDTKRILLSSAKNVYVAVLGRRSLDSDSDEVVQEKYNPDIDSMDIPSFLNYIRSLDYPALTEKETLFIRNQVTAVVESAYEKQDPKKKELISALESVIKYMTFYDTESYKIEAAGTDNGVSNFLKRVRSYSSYPNMDSLKQAMNERYKSVKSFIPSKI